MNADVNWNPYYVCYTQVSRTQNIFIAHTKATSALSCPLAKDEEEQHKETQRDLSTTAGIIICNLTKQERNINHFFSATTPGEPLLEAAGHKKAHLRVSRRSKRSLSRDSSIKSYVSNLQFSAAAGRQMTEWGIFSNLCRMNL